MTDGLMDAIKVFFNGVGVFFILYLIGYSTFLFLAVVVGASTLYQTRQQILLKNILKQDYYVPVSVIAVSYTHLDVYKRQDERSS